MSPRVTPASVDLLREISAAARALAKAEDAAADARLRRDQAVGAAGLAMVPQQQIMEAAGLKRAQVAALKSRFRSHDPMAALDG